MPAFGPLSRREIFVGFFRVPPRLINFLGCLMVGDGQMVLAIFGGRDADVTSYLPCRPVTIATKQTNKFLRTYVPGESHATRISSFT
jgi:hypothetical protein